MLRATINPIMTTTTRATTTPMIIAVLSAVGGATTAHVSSPVTVIQVPHVPVLRSSALKQPELRSHVGEQTPAEP